MEFDFSEFHPLDHMAFTPYCFGWAGGPTRHVALWYDYQFQWPWMVMWHAWQCEHDKHDLIPYWVGEPPKTKDDPAAGYDCQWCDYRMP